MRPNKTTQLQNLADELRTDEQYNFQIQWRGNGFWAIPDESRWIGDDGEYLGPKKFEAEISLRALLG